MKINNGELIKKMRKEMQITREDFAESLHVSTRQLTRIEAGEVDMDVRQFFSILELKGQPTEDFWLLYLDSGEYEDYKLYKRIKRFLRDKRTLDAKNALLELENKNLSKRPFISQFISLVKILLNDEIAPKKALAELYKAMHMSRPNFDDSKISEYRLTYNEIYIVTGIAIQLYKLGDVEKSISLYESIINSRENAKATEDDKAAIFPATMFNLSTILGKTGKYKESLNICFQAIDICREYNNLMLVPRILYNIASGHHKMGEEEQIYKPYLVRAYHCAYAIGDIEAAYIIKKDAKKKFRHHNNLIEKLIERVLRQGGTRNRLALLRTDYT